MRIIHRKKTYADGEVTLNIATFECDCGRFYAISETAYVGKPRKLDYKYCPYCGKEIKTEEIKENE